MAQTTDSSVLSIIAAFTSGFDVFRKLRERRRLQRKRRAGRIPAEKESGEELKLSRSLRQGPVDIQRVYEQQVTRHGHRYVAGDAIATASLAQTLVKLNTGLVSIITSFLCGKNHDVHLDYRSLTTLSDVSRLEAIEALGQLSNRLSRTYLNPARPLDRCTRCGHGKHRDACPRSQHKTPPRTKSAEALRPARPKERMKDRHSKNRSRRAPASHPIDDQHEVRKVHLSSASEPQLAIVRTRPKARRHGSSSSTSTQTEQDPARTPPPAYTSPPSSPPAVYEELVFPRERPLSPQLGLRPQPSRTPFSAQIPGQYPIELPSSPAVPYPPHSPPAPPVVRRRADKATPSTFTFASDSTKLGEIPMHRWNRPFDYAEMQRRNDDYYNGNHPLQWEQQQQDDRPKKQGLFGRMFRRKKGSVPIVVG